MINLPNGCRCSIPKVHPKNWKSRNAKTDLDWYIMYRLYDPSQQKPKLFILRGMNRLKTLQERQQATQNLLNAELERLLKTETIPSIRPANEVTSCLISDSEPTFCDALKTAFDSIEVSERTKRDIKYTLISANKALDLLNLSNTPVSKVKRSTLKRMLELCSNTPDRFNKNRSHLMILYTELCEQEIVENNPLRDIRKKKVIKYLRKTLTFDERKLVNNHLISSYPTFHRFLHIFYHSGSRISELLRVKTVDVDLENQRFKTVIRKGRGYREIWRTIKDIALPFWISAMTPSKPGNFVFSVGLLPGVNEIKSYQITKRWYRLVKEKLGIEADFYSLKHLHTTEIVDLFGENEAAQHNAHTSTSMTRNVYDVKRSTRHHSKVKSISNAFA